MIKGGQSGISSLALIESAIAHPYLGYHQSISRKAAALLRGIVGNHGFVDGNKRTGLILTSLLLERSGYTLELQGEERIDDLVVDVARGAVGLEELETWFKERITRL